MTWSFEEVAVAVGFSAMALIAIVPLSVQYYCEAKVAQEAIKAGLVQGQYDRWVKPGSAMALPMGTEVRESEVSPQEPEKP